MDLGIKGKTALVTASSAGIGLACATSLAREGAVLCLASRSEDKLKSAAAEIKSLYPDSIIHTFTVDMSKPQNVKRFCDDLKNKAGSPDILVNNTGGPKAGNFFDLSLEDWEKGYHLIMSSTVILYQEFIPAMRRRKWGRIVNITSTTSRQPIDGLTLSNAYRPGILGVAKLVADEVAVDNVLINTVMPGITMTARMKELSEARKNGSIVDRLSKETPVRRAADPMEQGDAVAFLCSDKSSFITGTALAVDGGSIRCL